MAVARAITRLVAGAEVALALTVLTACAGGSQQVHPRSPSPPAATSGATGTPTPGRQSLFGAFEVVGGGDQINLGGVPDGASCRVSASELGRSAPLQIEGTQPRIAGRDSLQFRLANPPAGATIAWSATCTLYADTATRPFRTSTESSGTGPPGTEPPTRSSTTPTAAPAHTTATPTPRAATPSAP